jgi:NAD(P)H-hydrate epimerase
MSPNLITLKLDGERLNNDDLAIIKRQLVKSTAVIVGPGLGIHEDTFEAVNKIIKILEVKKTPTLIDADALKAFANKKHRIEMPCVLTPHMREYEILMGSKVSKDLHGRMKSIRDTAQDLDTVILLKSHVDIISDGYRLKLNFSGNPGMTVGGTGDVLSGIVGGFLAQGIEPFEAAVAGAFVNGAAGDFVKAKKGHHILASDLLEWIPKVIDNPMCHKSHRTRTLN